MIAMVSVLAMYIPITVGNLSPWTKRISLGIVVMMVAVAVRSLYWDVVQLISGERWITVYDFFGGQEVSSIFNIGILISCIVLLSAKSKLK